MRKFKQLFLGILIILGMVFGSAGSVLAANNPADFTVSPIMPSNQRQGVTGYYDLIVQPNQTQRLEFKLNNNSNQRTTYEINLNPAMTSDGGAIDYGQINAKIDKTVPFDIRNVAKLEKTTYTVESHSSITIPITVKIPNQTWQGRVLGGINVLKAGKGDKTGKAGNATLNTKVAYSIAISLQNKVETIVPELNYLKTKPTKVNGYTTFQMMFRNPKPTIISDLIFTTVIKKEGKKYIQNTSTKYTVAPNTRFNVNLGMAGQRVVPGKYTVDIVAKSGPFYKWHFTDKFEITQEKADDVNKNAIFPDDSGNDLWKIIAIIAIAVFLIALIIIIILWRRRIKNEE